MYELDFEEPLGIDYLVGGVPTWGYFESTIDDLQEIYNKNKISSGINRQLELVLIGLTSYFEAFCKDQFAAILNILPELISELKKNGQNTLIDAVNIPAFEYELTHKVGFLVAENFDFGTAKKINSLYRAILGITPFSSKESKIYDNMLRDRNLLVHHGGIFTSSYLNQNLSNAADLKKSAFFESLVVSSEDVLGHIKFVRKISMKLASSSQSALRNHIRINAISLSREKESAIVMIGVN